MQPLITDRQAEIAHACRRFHVRRLEVFGSAAGEADFDHERSDVDFLVEYEPDYIPPRLSAFFDLREELSRTLGRPVDLVMGASLRNPFIRAAAMRSKETVYAA